MKIPRFMLPWAFAFTSIYPTTSPAQGRDTTPPVVTPPKMPLEKQMAKPAPTGIDHGMVQTPAPLPGEAAQTKPKKQPPPSGAAVDDGEKAAYEEKTLAKLGRLSSEIHDLRAKSEALTGRRRAAARESIRTASGNRVVALTKLEHLSSAGEAGWERLKPSVDQAMRDLEAAVNRARTYTSLAH